MQIGIRDTRYYGAGFHVYGAAAVDVVTIVEAGPGTVEPVGEVGFGAYGPSRNPAVMEIVSHDICCLGCVSRWIWGWGLDEGLEEGDVASLSASMAARSSLFVMLVHCVLREAKRRELKSL